MKILKNAVITVEGMHFFRLKYSFDLSTFLVFTVVFLFVLCVISTPRSDIPGPFALPFFGNIFFLAGMGNRRHKETLRLYKNMEIYFDYTLGNVWWLQYVAMKISMTLLWSMGRWWATAQKDYLNHRQSMETTVKHTFECFNWGFFLSFNIFHKLLQLDKLLMKLAFLECMSNMINFNLCTYFLNKILTFNSL